MRTVVSLVIEMTDEQVKGYVAEFGLPFHDGPLRARDVVSSVREAVLNDIQCGTVGQFADVNIKGG